MTPGWNRKYPRLHVVTVGDLLKGKGIDTPPLHHVSATFKKAPKAEKKKGGQQTLLK